MKKIINIFMLSLCTGVAFGQEQNSKATADRQKLENARVLEECKTAYAAAYQKLGEEIGKRELSPTEFFNTYLKLGQVKPDVLEANKHKVSKSFYHEQSVSLHYQKLGLPTYAPNFYVMAGKKPSEAIPDGYWSLDKAVKIDDGLISNPDYASYMKVAFPGFLLFQEKLRIGKLDSAFTDERNLAMKIRLVETKYTPKLKSATITALLEAGLKKATNVELIKPLIDKYAGKYISAEDLKQLLIIYDNYANTAIGKTPPAFTLKDLDGKDVTLKDFAGKVVYMDFWASWCAPCRAEMKNGAPKLHAQFKDNQNVVFLYVSLDSKVDAWKKAIDDDKIEGVHVLSQATSGVDTPVAKVFNIGGIPHYVIIGKDGKILDNNAPRPSQSITTEKLKAALAGK